MNTNGLRVLGGILAFLELVTILWTIIIFALRLGTGIIPSLILGAQCIHLISPVTLLAAVSVSDNKYAINGANVLYCFVALVDVTTVIVTVLYPRAFRGELFWWSIGLHLTLFVVDAIVIVILTYYNKEVSAQLRRSQQEVLQKEGSEYLAKQNVWLPSRRVFKVKFILSRTWKIGIFFYLIYVSMAIIENIFSLRMTWTLLVTVPYLWEWPFINILVGPGGETGQDPEPWVKHRPSGVSTVTYFLVIVGSTGLILSAVATVLYWPSGQTAQILSSITISFLLFLILLNVWTLLQMTRLDVALARSQKNKNE